MILEHKEINYLIVSIVSPSICHEVMRLDDCQRQCTCFLRHVLFLFYYYYLFFLWIWNYVRFQLFHWEKDNYLILHNFLRTLGWLPCMGSCGISQFSSVQSLSCVWFFATPWIRPRPASLSLTNSRSSLKLMCIKSVMPSSHLILCRPLFLLPPISPSIRVFSNASTLRMRWPKYWSFSFSISPSNEHLGLISSMDCWISLQSTGLSRVFSNTTVQNHQFFGAQLSSQSNFHIHKWPLGKL